MIFSNDIVGSVCEFLGMMYHMFLHVLIVFSTNLNLGKLPSNSPTALGQPWFPAGFGFGTLGQPGPHAADACHLHPQR